MPASALKVNLPDGAFRRYLSVTVNSRPRRDKVEGEIMRRSSMVVVLAVSCLAFPSLGGAGVQEQVPGFVLIPEGAFEMGDHFGYVDPKHGGDETPVHTVRLDAFYMGIYDVTTEQYCDFLNSALSQKQVVVRHGGVYLAGSEDLLCETRMTSSYSRIGWDDGRFSVLDGKEKHPVVCIRWPGAAAYCNWLSAENNRPLCYNTSTWDCDFTKSGYRLPTEAEWEYAARGGLKDPYRDFPWGDEPDPTKANWPESNNPFRVGPMPWTTPVGFFNGRPQHKADFGWPGESETYQTSNGANGYGLYDMAGNVWQFVNDWYVRDYYAYSPAENPPGPDRGSPMPDGKPYRGMRGGNWYNGENGHSRVSNRNPSYWRGPQDPDHPYYHVGFRVVLPANAESRPTVKLTPVQRVESSDAGQAPRPSRQAIRPARPEVETPGDRPTRRETPGPERASGDAYVPMRSGSLMLKSSAVGSDGVLPAEFTGDGAAASPPLEWSGAPAGTKSYALIMHHAAPDQVKWYWILYDIPADVNSLSKNTEGIGTLGSNSINDRREYAPPHSKGPGAKTYICTVYALSASPQLAVPPERVTRDVLLAAIKDRILDSAELRMTYTRPGEDPGSAQPPAAPSREPKRRDSKEPSPPGGRPSRNSERDGNQAPDEATDRPPRDASNQIDKEQQAALESLGYFGPNRDRPSGGGAGGDGGREAMAENKTPTSPNPGQTVGLFLNTPKAFAGYTLFAPKHNTVTYLIDNAGRVVHQWKSAYEPGQSVYLKPDGHLLHCCFTRNHGFTGGGEGGRIEEFDWDGNLVWEFEYSTDEQLSHHDIAPLPNGNLLMLVVEKKSYDECLAAGFNPQMLRDRQLFPDSVVEVQPTYPKGGTVVWEWHVWDHLIQDFDPAKANYGDVAAHPELVDVNCNGRPVPAFWNHMNSIDYSPKLDQIVLSVRGCNEIWFLDHSTTTEEAAGHIGGRHGKGGGLIYRWGNPAAYGRGSDSGRQLIQQHDAQWIPDGYPGAGHLTIFNNGYDRGWSSIEEIVPPLDANGRYVLEPGKAYGPEKPEWHYEAKNRADFFSSEISGAHRLPNGNTLICAGVVGNLFEITPAGETVWQYVNPMVRGGILAQGELPGKDVRGHLFNAVFKVHRYALDYPGLAGRDLTPTGVIELPASEKGKTELDQLNEQPRDDRGPGGGPGRGERRGGPGQRPPRDPGPGGGDSPPPLPAR